MRFGAVIRIPYAVRPEAETAEFHRHADDRADGCEIEIEADEFQPAGANQVHHATLEVA